MCFRLPIKKARKLLLYYPVRGSGGPYPNNKQ